MKKALFKGGFEPTYVSHSQVIVRHVSNMRIVVRSQFGKEILRTNIHSKYVVATTQDTLLLGDIDGVLSEIQWHGNGKEKFNFDNPAVCVVYYAGEVTLVEYGQNDTGSVRTSHTNSHVLSVRVTKKPQNGGDRNNEESKEGPTIAAKTI